MINNIKSLINMVTKDDANTHIGSGVTNGWWAWYVPWMPLAVASLSLNITAACDIVVDGGIQLGCAGQKVRRASS